LDRANLHQGQRGKKLAEIAFGFEEKTNRLAELTAGRAKAVGRANCIKLSQTRWYTVLLLGSCVRPINDMPKREFHKQGKWLRIGVEEGRKKGER